MHIALSGHASLATDLAQRALIQSFREGVDPARVFSANLFAEASDYLVSRDLPGFVGEQGRTKNVSQALEFKASIRRAVVENVGQVRPPTISATAGAWATYVASVVELLRGTGRRRS